MTNLYFPASTLDFLAHGSTLRDALRYALSDEAWYMELYDASVHRHAVASAELAEAQAPGPTRLDRSAIDLLRARIALGARDCATRMEALEDVLDAARYARIELEQYDEEYRKRFA